MTTKPKFLFVCIGNSARSQMAEGFARALSGGKLEAFSAGSRPAGIVSPSAIQVMKEAGLDISGHKSKSVHAVPQERYDVIVGMGCGDACPQLPARRRVEWKIPDPVTGDLSTFVRARDMVKDHMTALLKEEGLLA